MPAIAGVGSTPCPCGHQLVCMEARARRHEHGGTCVAPYRVQGLGLLGRAAKTQSTSILAWRLLASPLVMGYLPGVSRPSCPAEQVQQLSHSTVTYKKCHLLSLRPPRRQTSSEGVTCCSARISTRWGPTRSIPPAGAGWLLPMQRQTCEGCGGSRKQSSALSPAPTVTGRPQTPLPEAQTGQCSGLLYPGLRPLG